MKWSCMHINGICFTTPRSESHVLVKSRPMINNNQLISQRGKKYSASGIHTFFAC